MGPFNATQYPGLDPGTERGYEKLGDIEMESKV